MDGLLKCMKQEDSEFKSPKGYCVIKFKITYGDGFYCEILRTIIWRIEVQHLSFIFGQGSTFEPI